MSRGLAGCALLLAACGGSGPEDWPEGRPLIERLKYLDQTPGQPSELQFLLSFADSDGNLSTGQLILSIDDEERSRLSLAELFAAQTPAIAAEAKIGELEVLVDLGSDATIDRELELAFRLEDAAGEESNEPRIRMKAVATTPASLKIKTLGEIE